VKFQVKVDDAALHAAMRSTRRELGQDVKRAFLTVGQEVVLPAARRNAPVKTGWLRRNLMIGATTTRGFVQVKTRTRRERGRVALLEFGGTRRDTIRPRTAGNVLRINGRFARYVRTVRRYEGQHFMERAVDGQQPRIRARLTDELTKAIQAHVDRAGAGL